MYFCSIWTCAGRNYWLGDHGVVEAVMTVPGILPARRQPTRSGSPGQQSRSIRRRKSGRYRRCRNEVLSCARMAIALTILPGRHVLDTKPGTTILKAAHGAGVDI